MGDKCVKGPFEEMVWAFEEAVWRQWGPSISVVGCSEKDLVERVQGGTHLVSRLRGCEGARSLGCRYRCC